MRIVFRLSAKGTENIPESGPFIAACNHVAYFDPVIIGAILKREIAYLARAELFDQFLISGLVREFYDIPVKRKGSDITSIKTCLHILQTRDIPLLIFQEGPGSKQGSWERPEGAWPISLLSSRFRFCLSTSRTAAILVRAFCSGEG